MIFVLIFVDPATVTDGIIGERVDKSRAGGLEVIEKNMVVSIATSAIRSAS
jgi:hypothetical protein